MQFFFLVLVNIFIGAVLYLVISLKLERSAQEFRSQRLRKEMDEIIQEFNSTAERNISLLENRITVLQRLLERSGGIKSLDISIGDVPTVDAASPVEKDPVTSPAAPADEKPQTPSRDEGGISSFSTKIVRRMRDGMDLLLDALEKNTRTRDRNHPETPPVRRVEPAALPSVTAADDAVKNDGVETVYLDEGEIREMILSAENRYEAIKRLHGRGYSLESISRCSGIPVGEIALVLNLQNTRTS